MADDAPQDLRDARARAVKQKAAEFGFDAVGIADARAPLDQDFAHYERFVADGFHGDMAWLAENAETRRSVDHAGILPRAKSVICLARRYKRNDDERDPEFAKKIARYARGRDYHNHVRRKLRQLSAFVRSLAPDTNARPIVDDAPLLERAWAARAGLGFVGKNGLLIVPGLGSYVLLGEIVTTLELTADSAIPERCGSCTRCLDGCPTQAFPRPFVLDARRCLAYLTIEHRGDIPEEFQPFVGERFFGCDACQEVCPFNASSRPQTANTSPFEPHPRWASTTLADVEALTEATFPAFAEGSPLYRAGVEGLTRNARIARKFSGSGGSSSNG
mgnify:CR=1 FL=1